MAPRGSQRGGGRAAATQRRDADLSGLLSVAQKTELVALVTSITNSMQDHICQVFDRPLQPLVSYSPNAIANIANSHIVAPPSKGDDKVLNQQSIDQARANAEPSVAQGELKKETLAAFQKWQTALAKRISEVSVIRDQQSQTPLAQGRFLNGKQPNRGSGRGLGRSPSTSSRGGFGGRRGTLNDSTRTITGGHAGRLSMPTDSGAPNIPLIQLAGDKRQLLFHAILLLVLSLDSYSAYSRVFTIRMAAHFRIPSRIVLEEESRIARSLSHAANSVFTEEGLLKKTEDGKKDRRGRAPPVPPCLAPPLDDAKIGSVGESTIGRAAAATVLGALGTLSDGGLAACMFFGMCGPRGSAAKTLETFTRDVQDVGLVPLYGSHKLEIREGNMVAPEDRRLRLTIGINGWARADEGAAGPWRVLGENSEAYSLAWEQETLEKIGASLNTVMGSLAWKNAKKEFVNRNVFSNLKAFTWPSSLLKISKIVDNPWSVGMVRADKVGMALADAIINKVQGERGVSLLGYGLGARVIYTCLMSLSERRVFGQVENVIMMGMPAPSSQCVWTALRSAVSGRVINVFSENDFILGFLHRTGCIQFGVAGLQRIQGVYGIENVDASKPVTNHLRYPNLIGRILKDIAWEDLNMAEVMKAEEELKYADGGQEPSTAKRQEQAAPSHMPQTTGKDSKKKAGRRTMEAQFQAMSIVH